MLINATIYSLMEWYRKNLEYSSGSPLYVNYCYAVQLKKSIKIQILMDSLLKHSLLKLPIWPKFSNCQNLVTIFTVNCTDCAESLLRFGKNQSKMQICILKDNWHKKMQQNIETE